MDDIIERGSTKSDKRAAMADLSVRDLQAIAQRGNQCAWMLARVAVLRRKAADNLVQACLRASRKMEFYSSRAHGIIVQSFLAIEDVFRHAGFGGWMPFRYADQWLAFTDVMRKICAANGLISPCGPNHWVRFIEETPNVPIEKEFPQAPLQMPEGLGATKKYREIADFDELVARARGAPSERALRRMVARVAKPVRSTPQPRRHGLGKPCHRRRELQLPGDLTFNGNGKHASSHEWHESTRKDFVRIRAIRGCREGNHISRRAAENSNGERVLKATATAAAIHR